jgi:hypothetical protein
MVSGMSPFTTFHVVLSLLEENRGIAMAAARLYVAEDIAQGRAVPGFPRFLVCSRCRDRFRRGEYGCADGSAGASELECNDPAEPRSTAGNGVPAHKQR